MKAKKSLTIGLFILTFMGFAQKHIVPLWENRMPLGTQFDKKTLEAEDEIDKISARPNFMALVYPVISMKHPAVHNGSGNNRLGGNPSEMLAGEFSNELHVDGSTPPTFLVHSTDDKAVSVENGLNFYKALKDAGASAELHVYPYGGHGYALAVGKGYLQKWTDRLAEWLEHLNL